MPNPPRATNLDSPTQAQLPRHATSWQDEGNADATGVMPASKKASAESQLYGFKGEGVAGGGGSGGESNAMGAGASAYGDRLALSGGTLSAASSAVDATTAPAGPAIPGLDGITQADSSVPSAPELAKEKDYDQSVRSKTPRRLSHLSPMTKGPRNPLPPPPETALRPGMLPLSLRRRLQPSPCTTAPDNSAAISNMARQIASTSAAPVSIAGDLPTLGTASRQRAMTIGPSRVVAMLRQPAARDLLTNPTSVTLLSGAPDQGEAKAADEPFSTFSLHVSDVSFRLAQAALAQGQMPDPDTIRPEEFYNAFDYGDPGPATGEKIACRIEQARIRFCNSATWCGSR